MENQASRRLSGASKIIFGILGIKGACVVGIGGGIIGGFCKEHNMMWAAKRYGMESGKRNFQKVCIGWKELFTDESVEEDIVKDKKSDETKDKLLITAVEEDIIKDKKKYVFHQINLRFKVNRRRRYHKR